VSAYFYILRWTDGSYYVGTTRGSLEKRIAEHDAGTFDGYTTRRRPVTLVFHQQFERICDFRRTAGQGLAARKQRGFDQRRLRHIARPLAARCIRASFETRPPDAPQDEVSHSWH
jgi:GIY-YIG catalytic domain